MKTSFVALLFAAVLVAAVTANPPLLHHHHHYRPAKVVSSTLVQTHPGYAKSLITNTYAAPLLYGPKLGYSGYGHHGYPYASKAYGYGYGYPAYGYPSAYGRGLAYGPAYPAYGGLDYLLKK